MKIHIEKNLYMKLNKCNSSLIYRLKYLSKNGRFKRHSVIVEKLNTKNYTTWKFKIEMLLIKKELFEIITENVPTPTTTDW